MKVLSLLLLSVTLMVGSTWASPLKLRELEDNLLRSLLKEEIEVEEEDLRNLLHKVRGNKEKKHLYATDYPSTTDEFTTEYETTTEYPSTTEDSNLDRRDATDDPDRRDATDDPDRRDATDEPDRRDAESTTEYPSTTDESTTEYPSTTEEYPSREDNRVRELLELLRELVRK